MRTAHTELAATPIQAGLNRAEHGTLEIADRYREGLDGLADFDYAWLHRPRDPAGDAPLRQIPFLLRSQRRMMGIFATRGPRRVNPIGLSLIQLLQVTGPTVVFAGVDLVDGTPVIDLKPYVTRFDRPPENRDAAGSTSSPSATAPHPRTSPNLSHQPDGNSATTLTDYRTS